MTEDVGIIGTDYIINKEYIFNLIDEYMDLRIKNYHVKILGNEDNKDKAFAVCRVDEFYKMILKEMKGSHN